MIDQHVTAFLETLDDPQRRRVMLPFDRANRRDGHDVPRSRRGVPLRAMAPDQRAAAMAILRAALSERGYQRCEDIMRLDASLAESAHDPETYDPGNYVVSVLGRPSSQEPWGWRFEGHHVSLDFVHAREGMAVTPTLFFGATPSTVPHGPLRGLRVLGAEEDIGRQLMRGLETGLRARALIAATAFGDILTGPGRDASLRAPAGVSLSEMPAEERAIALHIIDQFLSAMKPAVAELERTRLRAAGPDAIHFGWAGSVKPHQPHYYRLHGPSLVIEYDNTQDDANHVHAVWHDPSREFGEDLLRAHYRHGSHRPRPA